MVPFAFFPDTGKKNRTFQLVGVLDAPVGGEAAFESGIEQGLTIELDGSHGIVKALDSPIDLVEERFDLCNYAALFVERR